MTFASSFAAATSVDGDLLLTDFTSMTSDLGWYVVNDNVMGGRSEGDFEQTQGTLRFSGSTNTNGGGFSSIRTMPLQLDLSDHTGIRLRAKGDGRRYTWRLTTDARWRGRPVSYWADFQTTSDAWITADIPFSRFVPRMRGYRLDGPALDPASITSMGLMIYDKQDGPFSLQVDSVHIYSNGTPLTLGQYRWKNRVLVLSASSGDDRELVKQKIAVARTTDQFEDRDLVLVTLLSQAASTAGDQDLTANEVEIIRADLGIRPDSFALKLIGKDGSIKLSKQAATPMIEIYELIDAMPMRQIERSSR